LHNERLEQNGGHDLIKCFVWNSVSYRAETWALGKVMKGNWKLSKCGHGGANR